MPERDAQFSERVKDTLCPALDNRTCFPLRTMPGKRGRRTRGGGVPRAVRRYVHRAERMIAYGRQLFPSSYPGAVIGQPWNTATVELGSAGDQDITVKLLCDQLTKQIGLAVYNSAGSATGYVNVDIRPLSIRCWALSAQRPISLSVIWLTEDASVASQIFTSWPGANRLPAVGYEWSKVIQTAGYNYVNDGTSVLAKVDVSGNNAKWLAYFQVLWKSSTHMPIAESAAKRCEITDHMCSLSLE